MKLILPAFILMLVSHTLLSQNNLSAIYEEGVVDGEFQSWYPNGQLKVEGSFQNNLKVGLWTLWDSIGNKIMTRNYGDNYSTSVVIFKNGITDTNDLHQQEALFRNDDGIYSFAEVVPNDVVFSKRLWRILRSSQSNEVLFQNNEFYNNLINLIESGLIKGYSAKSDQFDSVLDSNTVSNYNGITPVGFKIKEDWFYDNSRNLGESRIIGICPIIQVEGKEKDAFWVYYPEIRKHLGKLGLDDIFFFHQYSSEIIRESNVNGKYLSEYIEPKNISEEILSIESQLIEIEVGLWIKLATE